MDLNTWAVVGGATVTGLFALTVARMSKLYDARAAAEAALIGSGPTIIAEQNRRISEMQSEINRLWASVQEAYKTEQACRDELREYRHQNRDLQQKIIALELRLGRLEG